MYFSTGTQLQAALNALPASKVGEFTAFDSFYYGQHYMGAYSGTLTPIEHFVQIGAARGYQPSADFDPVYYASAFADLRDKGFDSADLIYHFMQFGLDEGRAPNSTLSTFDGTAYLAANPDVNTYVLANLSQFGGSLTNGALAHYVKFGSFEGRTAPSTVPEVGQTFTLTNNVDTGALFIGTEGDDQYVAAYTTTEMGERLDTLTQFDNLDGGAGNDTLVVHAAGEYTLTGAAADSVTVSSIENVQFKVINDLDVDATGWTGVEAFDVVSTGGNVVVRSAASESVTVRATANVFVSDATVQAVDVTGAGFIGVDVGDAQSVSIENEGDGDTTVWASTAIEKVTVTAQNGEVRIQASDSLGDVEVTAGDGLVWVRADDSIGSVAITMSDADVAVMAADLGPVSITSTSDVTNIVGIVTLTNTTVDLTLENVNANIEVGTWFEGNQGATTLDLTLNGVSNSLDFTDGVVTSDSDLETINVTSAVDAYLNTEALSGSLTAINAGAATGDLRIMADVADGASLAITTGTGSDDVFVGGSGSDTTKVTVDAGEGDSYISANVFGQLNVTAGTGDDELETNVQALEVSGSSANLGGGDNTLTLHYNATLSEGDINAFDTLPVTGAVGTLNIASDVVLEDDATLDVSALGGEVHTLTFSDMATEDPQTLTIIGAAADLNIVSSRNFGFSDGGVLTVDAQGVENLKISASDDMGVGIDGSTTLASLTINGGDDIEANIANVATGADVTVTSSDDNVVVNLTDSALGVVNVSSTMGEDNSDASVNLHGDVSADSITITVTSDGEDAGFADAYLNIDDSDLSTVTIDAITLTADDEARLSVNGNSDATITLSAVELTSVDGDANMHVRDNTNTNITLGAITLGGDDTVLVVENNDACDAAVVIDLGAVSQTSVNDNADFFLNDNDASGNAGDLTINVASVTLHSSDSYALFDISYNDDNAVDGNVDINVGAVSVSAGGVTTDSDGEVTGFYGDDDATVRIVGNDQSTITLASVTVLAVSDAEFEVYDNDGDNTDDRAYVTVVGDVSVTSLDSRSNADTQVNVSYNDFATIDIGNVVVSAVSDAEVHIYNNNDSLVSMNAVTVTSSMSDAKFQIESNYCDSTVEVGNVKLNAGEDAYFYISDNANVSWDGDGSAIVGTVDITASDDATVFVGDNGEDYDVTMGDIVVVAGDDITFDLINGTNAADIFGAENVTLTTTGEWDGNAVVDVYMFEAAEVATLTINASSDATSVSVTIELDDVGDLATIDLSGLGSNSTTVLDLSDADAETLDAITILVGEGDLTVYVDNANSDATVETFEFVGTDIGTIVIGAGLATDGSDGNPDLDLDTITNNFDLNSDVLDVTALGLTSSDLVFQLIDYINDSDEDNDSVRVTFQADSGVTGSITLVGVTNTDELAESFLFAAG